MDCALFYRNEQFSLRKCFEKKIKIMKWGINFGSVKMRSVAKTGREPLMLSVLTCRIFIGWKTRRIFFHFYAFRGLA